MVGADGVAAVIDPKRDVADYLETARTEGLKIVAILETHPHADFVSGHVELARRTGGKIYVSHLAGASYEHTPVRDGQIICLGRLELVTMETPGHSPDSISFLVREGDRVTNVFTGDTLFVGDVGRPDLRDSDAKPAALAEALFDSLHGRLFALWGDVKIWPAHGMGSLCGRNISSAPSSTIRHERETNWVAKWTDRTEFVARMLENLPDRPAYFGHLVETNLRGAPSLEELPKPGSFSAKELEDHAAKGGTVLDVRAAPAFGAGHFSGERACAGGSFSFFNLGGFFSAV